MPCATAKYFFLQSYKNSVLCTNHIYVSLSLYYITYIMKYSTISSLMLLYIFRQSNMWKYQNDSFLIYCIYKQIICMQRLQVAVINNVYYVTTVSDRPHLY